jgi:HSP20 family molecular chaperone IbpA
MRDDDFFNSPFDDIFSQFFGQSGGRIRKARRSFNDEGDEEEWDESEENNRKTDYIDYDDKVFLIFELPGYDDKDLKIELKDKTLIIEVKKKGECKMQDYLSKKLCKGEIIKKTLQPDIDLKSMKHSFKNGILEVMFKKK